MAHKFHLITIPHSGTRFLNQLFFRIGFRNTQVSTVNIPRKSENVTPENSVPIEYKMNHLRNSDKQLPEAIMQRCGFPMLTSLHHPHKIALSWIRRLPRDCANNSLQELLGAYDTLIHCSTQLNVVYFDINCPIEKRMSHVVGVLKALGDDVYEHADKSELQRYVDEWSIVGATHDETKDYYEKHGTPPPDLYNWVRFDRAVNWYNKKIGECKYDYIA